MKLIVHHSALRMIESKIQDSGSVHGENYNSNCSYPTYKSIEHYIDQESELIHGDRAILWPS